MRFAKTTDLGKAAHRNEQVHALGAVLRATEKIVPLESAACLVTTVRLENNQGFLFEDFRTGEVLDRLGEELLVLHVPPDNLSGDENCISSGDGHRSLRYTLSTLSQSPSVA
jgi:hypothetical protein